MDALGLTILRQELLADLEVLQDSSSKALQRLTDRAPGYAEACAYELARHYGVLEKSFERICVAFENHFEKRGDYHERLLQRIAIELPGVRPAFVPSGELPALRELKGFRHVVRHAYDLRLRPGRLEELARMAAEVTKDFTTWVESFERTVQREQGW
jgi:hypothetical protein